VKKKQQQLIANAVKDITKSLIHLQKLKASIDNEEIYLTNLAELSITISVPQRFKLDVLVPGRRFLQSAVFQHYTFAGGKFKRGNQMLLFLFNDLIVFTQPKSKETRRLSTGSKSPQHFRIGIQTSPRGVKANKNKAVEFIYLDYLLIIDKTFGSDNLIEFSAPGKRVVVGVDDLKLKQDWLKNIRTQITIWKSQKDILEKKEKPSASSLPSAGALEREKKGKNCSVGMFMNWTKKMQK